ncbi:MAG: hypothetical protein MI923_22610 [Phycisphaerales bacterium]|nr:hypothetical protein [Phycisphaerales bacterium]
MQSFDPRNGPCRGSVRVLSFKFGLAVSGRLGLTVRASRRYKAESQDSKLSDHEPGNRIRHR